MNKYIYIILLLFTFSCHNTVIDDIVSAKIHFSTHILTLSKSIITESTLPDNSPIGVFSWGHHKDDGDTNTALRKDLTNTLYTKEAGNYELVTTVETHYPINPDTLLNFYAYYPYTPSATHMPESIPFDLNQQDDIMWATPVKNRSKTTNEEIVNLAFNHILSAITIKIQKADDIQEEMILQSISLENYSPTVGLNIQEGKLTQAASNNSYTIIKGLNLPIIPTEQTIVIDFLLCPVAKPVFIIRMSNKDYRIESSKAFESGKKQTYEFTLQAKDILLSGSITPWVDGGGSKETIYF